MRAARGGIPMAHVRWSGLVLLALSMFVAACGPSTITPPDPPIAYVAIGASDSVGVGADNPETQGWVPVLHSKLPTGSTLTNLGVSGALTQQALNQQLPVARSLSPRLVTVWLAVNDLNARVPAAAYEEALATILRSLREQPAVMVLVGNIPNIADLPVYQRVDRSRLQQETVRWNEVIGRLTAAHGATLVDLGQAWGGLAEHPEFVGRDGFHPSTAGHARLADAFYQAYLRAKAAPSQHAALTLGASR
ncbi:MAG: SGNH/GDSL hydrolase family protein [Chloroflexota bacterium]